LKNEIAMKSTIQFLNDQIESNEAWKPDHIRAMQCADLCDNIRLGLSLFNLFRSTDDLWSRHVQARSISFDPEVARSIYRAYEWWVAPCGSVFKAVDEFEKEGFKVEGAPELRAACVTVRELLKTNAEEVVAGLIRIYSPAA
jgi:hypothetical protein